MIFVVAGEQKAHSELTNGRTVELGVNRFDNLRVSRSIGVFGDIADVGRSQYVRLKAERMRGG